MERPVGVLVLAAIANLCLIGPAAAQTTPQTNPAQTNPAQPAPLQTTPIQPMPIEPAPTQTTSSETTSSRTTAAQPQPEQPNPNAVSDQFKSGANQLGNGFAQVGEGIKQGAILTWDSIVAGVTTTKSHLDGTSQTAAPAQPAQ